jgi:hypothetical protein
MATIKNAILQKMIDGAIRDLMVKTHVSNVVYAVDGAKEILLSTILAEILLTTDALGALANKSEVTYADLAAALKTLIDGKADSGTTLSAYGIDDAYTKTQIDGMISGVFTFKGAKDYLSELPAEGNKTGDVWQVLYSGTSGADPWEAEFAWDGEKWIELGSITGVDLSGYVPAGRKINNKELTEDITLDASDVDAVPMTRTVNSKALSSDITLNAADVGASRILYGATTPGDLGAGDLFIQILDD